MKANGMNECIVNERARAGEVVAKAIVKGGQNKNSMHPETEYSSTRVSLFLLVFLAQN